MMKKILMSIAFGLLASPALAVEVTVLTLPAFSPTNTLPGPAAAYAAAVDAFQKANPDITIKYEYLPSYNEALQAILARVAAKNLPDVIVIDAAWLSLMHESKAIRSLDKLWPAEDRTRFFPDTIKYASFGGEPYGVWIYNSYRGFFYRASEMKALGFEKAPTTWEEFLAMGEAAKAAGKYLTLLPGGPKIETSAHVLSVFWGLGGELVDEAGKPVLFEGKNREALERTYAMYRELIVKGYMPIDVSTYDETGTRPYFYSGQSLTSGQTSSMVKQMQADQPDLQNNLGAFTFPLPEGHHAVGVLGGFTYSIMTTDDSKVDASWRYIKYMTDPAVLGPINAVQGHLPVQFPIWKQEYFAKDPLMVQFKQAWEAGGLRPRPTVAYYPVMDRAISEQMAGVLSGEISPSQAVDNVRDQVMAEYERHASR